MMILIWIAIAAITACWAYREYGELLKVKTLLSHRLSNEGGLNLPCLVE